MQRIILVTDSMSPEDVGELGHMDHVLRRAVSMGMPAVQAIQAVTLNPATYSGLEQEIGGIAPGRFADVVLLEDLQSFHVRSTVIGGNIVAERGISLVTRDPIPLPSEMICSLKLSPDVSPHHFKIPHGLPTATIRVMELTNPTITAEQIIAVSAGSGVIAANVDEDLLKVAVFERHGPGGEIALGFLKGFGLKAGAVGTTANLDENTLLVVGCVDEDMALCANVLIEAGGGIAVVNQGQVLEKIEFPFGGIFSLASWQEVGEGLKRIQRCLRENGSSFEKPMCALNFLTFVTLPSLRITARGLVNVKERRIVPLLAG